MKKISLYILALAASVSAFAHGEFSLQDYNPRSVATAASALYSSACNPRSGTGLEALVSYASDGLYVRGIFAANDKLAFNLEGFGKKNGAIQFKDNFGAPTGEEYSPSRFFLSGGIGYAINDWLSAGLQGRLLNEALAPHNSVSNFASEISLRARKNHFTGVVCYNSLPSNIALATQHLCGFAEKHSIKMQVQYRYYTQGASQIGIGAEYGFADSAFLRAAYNYGKKSPLPDFLALGIGGRFKAFILDLSYQYNLEAKASIVRIGLGIRL